MPFHKVLSYYCYDQTLVETPN